MDPWKRHRIVNRVGILGAYLYLLLTIAVAWLGIIDTRSTSMHLVILGWMIFVVVMLVMLREIRCPRCGQRFYTKGFDFRQMAKYCLHCGLPKYADVNTAQKPDGGPHGQRPG
jgi:ribosomal protein L37E